jgi:hypothetical protein
MVLYQRNSSVVENVSKTAGVVGYYFNQLPGLGIDIGSVDEVVLLQSLFHCVTVQRIGRSARRGRASHGLFFPLHTRNAVESAVLAANIE